MMWTPEWIVVPSPIVTSSPMVAKGWMSTFLPSEAVGLTAAMRLTPIRLAARAGRKWSTILAKAAWTSSTRIAGVSPDANDRGQTMAATLLSASERPRSTPSTSVISPGPASRSGAAPWITRSTGPTAWPSTKRVSSPSVVCMMDSFPCAAFHAGKPGAGASAAGNREFNGKARIWARAIENYAAVSFASLTTFSTVKPKCFKSTPTGADAP